jgi:hypothetical protein
MAIHVYNKFKITPFWTDEYKTLDYVREDFNDLDQVEKWLAEGYENNFTGDMCDMRKAQPQWNHRFLTLFSKYGWKDIGTSYYRMMPGTVLPTHSDLYKRYVDILKLKGQEHTIKRAVVFLEDWQPGHLSEISGEVVTKWHAGQVLEWTYDTPHMAGNTGTTPRYTLQITGHI